MYQQFNTIQIHGYIPKEAFLYIPTGESDLRKEDDYKLILEKNVIKRLIFQGGINYTQQENNIINQFYKYLFNKQIIIGKQWSKGLVYKFLLSTNFDYKKTIQQIHNHTQYQNRIKNINFQSLKSKVEPFLNQGIFYINGRDSKFRPIIVVDVAKINSLNLDQVILNDCLIYFFQFLYRFMFINGQVQNVVSIINVGYTSPLHLIRPMKMTINFLQGNYKYKLHQVYILKATSMFNFAFGIAKKFMREDTIRKVVLIQDKKTVIHKLLEYCNPNQLQKQYGGNHEDLKNGQFWPPKQFSSEYQHPNIKSKMITKQQYRKFYKQGALINRKIYKPFINIQIQNNTAQLNYQGKQIKNMKKIQPNIKIKKQGQSNIIRRIVKNLKCTTCFGQNLSKNISK